MSLFKIQLENGEFYKSSKGGRVQHYLTLEKAEVKIKKLGDIALNAIVVESKARTVAVKIEIPEETNDTATAPAEFVTDAEAAKVTNGKARTAKVETPEEIVPESKVEKVSKKKSAAKAEKIDKTATDAKVAGIKTKKPKPKKAPSND